MCLEGRSEGDECGCPALAISTYAAASMNLMWGTRRASLSKTGPQPAEALRCLKATMERHEMLLRCPEHRSQPDFMALFVSLCDMMIVGLNYFASQVPRAGARTTRTTPSPEREADHLEAGAEASRREDRLSQAGGRLLIIDVHHQPHESELKVNPWALDHDDETDVLRSLLISRTKRLVSLLERLCALVDVHGQHMHKEIVSGLQARSNDLLISLDESL